MKSRSHEIECYNDGIAQRFDGHLRSFAAELPVNYQNDWIQLNEYRLSWNRCQGCNLCFMKDFRCDRSRQVFHSYWTGNENMFSEWFLWYAFRTEYFIPDAEMNSVNLDNRIIIYYTLLYEIHNLYYAERHTMNAKCARKVNNGKNLCYSVRDYLFYSIVCLSKSPRSQLQSLYRTRQL